MEVGRQGLCFGAKPEVRAATMASLNLKRTQAVANLADHLRDYLPGSAPPYAKTYTFADAARQHGVGHFWLGGSKLPALTQLLENVLAEYPQRFCPLVLTIVREGIKYRKRKGNPLTVEDIEELNHLLLEVGFKIPELYDSSFLRSLPRRNPDVSAPPPQPTLNQQEQRRQILEQMRTRFYALIRTTDEQERGYEFERLLHELFALSGLSPRASFRVTGEQIDGSFEFNGHVYLIEARWRSRPANEADLLVFRGKVEGKSQWTRGLFLSVSGFTQPAIEAITRGKSPNIVLMDGADLVAVLEGHVPLDRGLAFKIRSLAETGRVYVPLKEWLYEN